ncbi:SURF1 family cytochrome oxidase biogenesis protein [Ponticaulis sp.]|uniref:SURF1 family cytochrome oxidase biogenesis protein n=1 Tax=Ponticaulis sp. TaxID=2020902 RepID=UPI000B6BA633|nr:SURF1 family cytochrome oxidase biogenesis protein [Ponticaulis sp.]MAI90840.1 hypothetical protein [Ponticaulis sp.]OUX98815.1 MAG: hypothetical protein CBB65_10390 [Hyphomonadaceae bacterium TMED5]|tara:strand:- start:1593 stop:2309 length:717 start_codon:yes stop_codon:yes gene_type:complete
MTFRPLPVMSFLLIPGLALLLWLGSWQWARYQEKMAAAEGLDVSESYSLDIRSADYPLQFAYSTFEGQSVWRSFQPVEACLTNGADTEWCPDALVFVDTGLVQGLEPDASLVQRLSAPDLTQAYYVMQPGQRSMITPADKPEDRLFYTSNAEVMATALGSPSPEQALILEPESIIQFALRGDEAISRTIANPFADISRLDNLPPQRHLGYAITWFGLALGMIGVYLAFHIARGRLRFR